MEERVKNMLLRYFLIILLILLIDLIYILFLPLTIYPVYFVIKLLYSATLQGDLILIGSKGIEIIKACVGASAIFLLVALNLATPSIKWKKRLKIFLFTIIAFLIFNWIRIFVLSVLFIQEFILFNQIHTFTWYFISTVAVIVIWFIAVSSFKIKSSPFLSDIIYLGDLIK